jgi:hypothetical protein
MCTINGMTIRAPPRRFQVREPLFLSDFKETYKLSRQIFGTFSNIKFCKNPSSGSRVVQCGRVDWHDEANLDAFAKLRKHLRKKEECFGDISRNLMKKPN